MSQAITWTKINLLQIRPLQTQLYEISMSNLKDFSHKLECLRSEDTPRRLTITHTIESYWISSQKKSKLQILKNCQNYKFFNFETNITRDTPEVAW